MLGKRIMLASASLADAVDSNRITSVPYLRSWRLSGVAFLLGLRSMVAGVVACQCTLSLGLELGRYSFSSLSTSRLFPLLFQTCQLDSSLLGPVVTTGRS